MDSISESQIREFIREILRNADLSALSSKTVRKKLEEHFQTDLTSRKQEIDDILMSLINSIGDEKDVKQENDSSENGDSEGEDVDEDEGTSNGKASASAVSSASKNGSSSLANTSSTSKRKRNSSSSSGSSSDSDAGVEDHGVQKSKSSAKKRRGSDTQAKADDETSSDDGVDDEALARKLQQQELRVRPRSSKQKVEKKPKSTKAASSEGSGKKKGNSLYSQECVLSHELAAVMGTDRLARKDVVSRMWKIFKERNLMDPKNKQYVICDEQLEKVFKCKKFKAFSMMKILKTHIKDAKLIQT